MSHSCCFRCSPGLNHKIFIKTFTRNFRREWFWHRVMKTYFRWYRLNWVSTTMISTSVFKRIVRSKVLPGCCLVAGLRPMFCTASEKKFLLSILSWVRGGCCCAKTIIIMISKSRHLILVWIQNLGSSCVGFGSK